MTNLEILSRIKIGRVDNLDLAYLTMSRLKIKKFRYLEKMDTSSEFRSLDLLDLDMVVIGVLNFKIDLELLYSDRRAIILIIDNVDLPILNLDYRDLNLNLSEVRKRLPQSYLEFLKKREMVWDFKISQIIYSRIVKNSNLVRMNLRAKDLLLTEEVLLIDKLVKMDLELDFRYSPLKMKEWTRKISER